MARNRDWFERFRPAGAPGSPSLPGVPTAGRECDEALAKVLAHLDPAEQDCARIRADAEKEARRRRDSASRDAAAILTAATAQSPTTRAAAFARAAQGVGAAEGPAADPVEKLRGAVRRRMPATVAEVHRALIEDLTMLSGVDLLTSVPVAGNAPAVSDAPEAGR